VIASPTESRHKSHRYLREGVLWAFAFGGPTILLLAILGGPFPIRYCVYFFLGYFSLALALKINPWLPVATGLQLLAAMALLPRHASLFAPFAFLSLASGVVLGIVRIVADAKAKQGSTS
jgi:hypothetical protein